MFLWRVCVCASASGGQFELTQCFHGDDFILAQALTGLVVSEGARVEQSALNALPAGTQSASDLRNRHHYSVRRGRHQ